jgi:hypothetical protein
MSRQIVKRFKSPDLRVNNEGSYSPELGAGVQSTALYHKFLRG